MEELPRAMVAMAATKSSVSERMMQIFFGIDREISIARHHPIIQWSCVSVGCCC
jgi:hypothetical protein